MQDYADQMDISFYDALRVAEEIPSIGRSLSKIDGFVTFIQGLKSKAEAYTVRELLEEIILPYRLCDGAGGRGYRGIQGKD